MRQVCVNNRRLAFTLTELLVVLAILAVLAGILFPVLASAKRAAKKAVCASNFHQANIATLLYLDDYGDRFMPVNQRPGMPPDSRLDKTWVQLVLPYAKSFSIFRCPSDTGDRPSIDATFDQDLVPDDTYSQFYSASMRTNLGYNYLNLAPIIKEGGQWISNPKTMEQISDPSTTLMFVDSVWDRKTNGSPTGGGNWLVVPPCRYIVEGNGGLRDSFDPYNGGNVKLFLVSIGWAVKHPNSGSVYGNAWPWHEGRMNVMRLDGSLKTLTPTQLTEGCNLGDSWKGNISNVGSYVWDAN